ncbi:hypothetical protein [Halobacteriovorax sp.]|uniref:hypothetical protein n=1 Tax=Halobacteriovorax sp. TaxID=2020862 RepID=UPI003561DF7A
MIKALLVFLFSLTVSASIFEISHDVINCSVNSDRCDIEVTFSIEEEDFLYINSCVDIEPTSEEIQYCIEDLEVRASRVYNNL